MPLDWNEIQNQGKHSSGLLKKTKTCLVLKKSVDLIINCPIRVAVCTPAISYCLQ